MTQQHAGQPLIRLEGIGRVFQTEEVETHALLDVELEIHPGEYVAVSGPSGSGKTTLLAILGLLDTPTSGRYTLAGEPVSTLGDARRSDARNRQIGFIFQAFNLIGELTVHENVELPLTYRGIPAAERRRRVGEALERVGLAHRGAHFPAQLSGGQQQRAAVARAIAGSPPLLLADEPTGNLDSANAEGVMALLGELHRDGATVVMVTHDPRFAAHAERTVHLLDGRVARESRARPDRPAGSTMEIHQRVLAGAGREVG
ncbi:MAG TPA: ABC transporter ATP-binding protein [Longimicrobium sp.]|nr:ABC transporter ATP-binding protein [Longimicrobium sp.]